jgi:hypothetical protein
MRIFILFVIPQNQNNLLRKPQENLAAKRPQKKTRPFTTGSVELISDLFEKRFDDTLI